MNVTVIVPIYGPYGFRRRTRLLLRCWKAQSIGPEVVLSYQGEPNCDAYGQLAREEGVEYVHSLPDQGPRYSPGRLRNAGIEAAAGDYVYVTDADVFPLAPDYLQKLAALADGAPGCTFAKPGMYRLLEGAQNPFLTALETQKNIEIPAGDRFCLSVFDNGRIVPVEPLKFIIEEDGYRLVCTREEHAYLMANAHREDSLPELVMKPDVHWGGIGAEKRAFSLAGGYHEGYRGWGCEDDDMLFKLAALGEVRILNGILPPLLVHCEHPRRIVQQYKTNLALFEMRKKRGVDTAINKDRQGKARYWAKEYS